MSEFQVRQSLPEQHVVNDLPSQISSQMLQKPLIACHSSTRSVISTSASITNGGSAYLYLPSSSNAFVKSGSCMLNFNISITTSAFGSTGGVAFEGSPIQDASALISRMQFSHNSVLENIQFYAQVSGAYVLNKTNANFVQNDMAAMAGASYQQNNFPLYGTTTTTSYNFSIPMLLGILNSPDSYFPLCLCSNSPSILIDFEPNLNKIFSCYPNNSVTSYTISNIQMVYQSISVDPLYVQELRQALMEGHVYSFSAQNITCVAYGDTTLVNQEIGQSCNSLNQVSWFNYTTAASQVGTGAFCANGQTIGQCYIDNDPVVNSRPQDVSSWQSLVYAQNKQAWCSSLWDPLVSRAINPNSTGHQVTGNNSLSPYVQGNFTASAPLNSYNEAGLIFCGRPANRTRIEVQKSSVSNSQLYVILVRDCIYQIGADGTVQQKF
jgi:hypothetical protein